MKSTVEARHAEGIGASSWSARFFAPACAWVLAVTLWIGVPGAAHAQNRATLQGADTAQNAVALRTQAALSVPEARRRTVTSKDGMQLAVYEYGPPDAPTLVLVHGYPDTAATWDQIVARLVSQFHIVTYDTRGAGSSAHPPHSASYALPKLSDDLEAVLDATAPGQRVHLVGHDWGSIQTWESVASRTKAERIASFTSISGPSLDLSSHWLRRSLANPAGWIDLARQAVASSYIPLVQLPQPSVVRDHFLKLLIFIQGDAKRPIDPFDSTAGANLYRANIPSRILFPTYDRIPLQNIQLIVPTKDAFVKEATMIEPVRTMPGATDNIVECRIDAGHWVQLSNPDDVTQCILNFTARVPA